MTKRVSRVLVTGASSGIGRAIARTLAKRGVEVAVHYNSDRAGAEETQRSLQGSGHRIVAADLTDESAIQSFWERVAKEFGQIDALVNNAGVYGEHSPLTADFARWRKAVEDTMYVNFFGTAHLSFLAARDMSKQGGGRIVNISSRA